jgi:hypothetical protein
MRRPGSGPLPAVKRRPAQQQEDSRNQSFRLQAGSGIAQPSEDPTLLCCCAALTQSDRSLTDTTSATPSQSLRDVCSGHRSATRRVAANSPHLPGDGASCGRLSEIKKG